jgi:hypothetical protein
MVINVDTTMLSLGGIPGAKAVEVHQGKPCKLASEAATKCLAFMIICLAVGPSREAKV